LEFPQSNRRDLIPKRTDSPVTDTDCKRVAFAPDLHWHDFSHIDPNSKRDTMSKLHKVQPNSQYSPATWPKRHGKYHRYQKNEENTTNAISNSPAIRILRIKHRFTTQSKRDGHCSEEHGLSTANTIENENHKDEIGERANTIINACDKRAATACNTEGFIHDGLVVPNHIYTGHLREYLDSNAMSAEAGKSLASGGGDCNWGECTYKSRVRHCGTVNIAIHPVAVTFFSASMAVQIPLYSASIQASFKPSECNLWRMRRASVYRSVSIRYRGDSGKKNMPIPKISAGTTWKARGNRHWNWLVAGAWRDP
jgi:hypothetical protein